MAAAADGQSKKEVKRETKLAIPFKKNENFSEWYSTVITRAELIDYYDVSGCYILRPWAFRIWEGIQKFLDAEIKKIGVENSYFPLFVSKSALEAEKDHVEGFAPEVAWVTRSGDSDLAEPIAIRPTSETIMYPAYAKWIRSHRDLPLKLNQWTNVVRWEFKHPTPFIRTREFLWQEGHTAHATKEEADEEVLTILDFYARVYEELLAVPVIKGRKSEKEKFAGGLYTTTVEGFIPANGRAIQGATSHCLGQNFSKMFDVTFVDTDHQQKHVWQNSWGLTTRSIGVMIMVHGDDKGLVLPPRVAAVQAIVVYITSSKDSEETIDAVMSTAEGVRKTLEDAGIRVKLDDRDNYTPAWKFSHWEQKGVPLRIEVGPRDVKNNKVLVARRDNGEKTTVDNDGSLASRISDMLETIHHDMLNKARKERDACVAVVTEWKDFLRELNKGKMVLTPWCETTESEEWVKENTRGDVENTDDTANKAQTLSGSAKTLCIPFEQALMPEGQPCFTGNGKLAKSWTLWGRSY